MLCVVMSTYLARQKSIIVPMILNKLSTAARRMLRLGVQANPTTLIRLQVEHRATPLPFQDHGATARVASFLLFNCLASRNYSIIHQSEMMTFCKTNCSTTYTYTTLLTSIYMICIIRIHLLPKTWPNMHWSWYDLDLVLPHCTDDICRAIDFMPGAGRWNNWLSIFC